MGWYIVKRIGQMIPVFFGATLLIYAMVFLTPGDPVAALAGDKPLTPELVKALRDPPERPVHRPVRALPERHLHRGLRHHLQRPPRH